MHSNAKADLFDLRDLRAWSVNSSEGRTIYAALQRLKYRQGMSINISSIKDAVKLSNRQFDNALAELERAGLIVVLDDVQEVRLIG